MALIGKMDTATSRFAQLLAAQIRNEFTASQQYVAVAVWFDSQDLPRLAGHFYRQALEERNHAMMIVQYLLDADARVVVPGVQAPQTDFPDAVAPVALIWGGAPTSAQEAPMGPAECMVQPGDVTGCQPAAFDVHAANIPTRRINAKGDLDPSAPPEEVMIGARLLEERGETGRLPHASAASRPRYAAITPSSCGIQPVRM